MGALVDLDTLPRCSDCQTPQLPGVTGACLYCRAVEAEGRLAAVSFWGEDDWMRKIAAITIDPDRPRHALVPVGFELDLSACGRGPVQTMARTQIPFRPELLTVDPACANLGVLLDAKIGNRAQLIDFAGVPLSLFNPMTWTSIEMMREVAGRFTWGVANIAQDITLTVDLTLMTYEPLVEEARKAMNLPVPTKFRAALWGRAGDDALNEERRRQLVPASINETRSVREVLEFHDLVSKMRTSGQ